MVEVYSVDKLIGEARRLAAEYRRATGKPLGIGAEIARHDAARLMGLDLVAPLDVGGFDAVGRGPREGLRIQIKGRAIFDEGKGGQRLGQIKENQEWDRLVLVLMDEDFEPYEIYEAERADVLTAAADSAASRRRRGALSVARFKNIARLVWTRENGLEDDGYWENTVGL